ncbi:MAG: hypothetical protein ACO3JL_07135, partial [Myxococcota bacterium]
MIAIVPALLLMTLCGAGPTAPTTAQRRVNTQAFTFKANTPEVILGETVTVDMELRLHDEMGLLQQLGTPSVRVSTGEVTPLVAIGPSVWRFRYLPPKDRFPHVALFGALVEDPKMPRAGFFALPLQGRGQVEVKTSPKSEVVLQIGDRSFGPVLADERGRALIDVLAPPGPTRAIARSVDPDGVSSQRLVDLGVPAFRRLLLLPVDDTVPATREGAAELLVYAVDSHGVATDDASILLRADVGRFAPSTPQAIAPGIFFTRYAPGLSSAGDVELIATLRGDSASTAKASITRTHGDAVAASLTPAVTRLEVAEDAFIDVRLALRDAHERALPAAAGYIEVSEGRCERTVEQNGDATTLRWFLPTTIAADAPRIVVKGAEGQVLAEATVELVPATAARLVLEPVAPLVANGRNPVRVRGRVEDRFGNLIVDVVPRLESAEMSVGTAVWAGDHFESEFVPSPREQPKSVVVRARAAELEAETTVALLPMAVPTLLAAAGVWTQAGYGGPVVVGPVASFLSPLPLELF